LNRKNNFPVIVSQDFHDVLGSSDVDPARQTVQREPKISAYMQFFVDRLAQHAATSL
jgi:hypothetical protein